MCKRALILFIVVLTTGLFSKDYYVKQLIITPNMKTSQKDTLTQETYIMKDLIIVKDDVSIQFTTDSLYTFYNLIDSTYFTRNAKELQEIAKYADGQFENFEISPTGEKHKIEKWNTEKYIGKVKITGMEMKLDLYIAKGTGLPSDLLFRQQERMNKNAPNIQKMLDKIKNTGGIVVKEVARIQGEITSIKQTLEANEMKTSQITPKRPKGFSKLKK